MTTPRAWVLQKSGRRLDLLDPDPQAWTDQDLAIGLSRTYRWAGHSAWDLPLSVAQHSLTVLALREMSAATPLSPAEALRELCHDATEALMGGWDPITPLKPHLGPGFEALVSRLQGAVDARYSLPPWTPDSYALHKHADRLAAASEALHVVGWGRCDIRESLRITFEPVLADPLPTRAGLRPWEPWPPKLAAEMFLQRLESLQASGQCAALIHDIEVALTRRGLQLANLRARTATGAAIPDTWVSVEAGDGSGSYEGLIIAGPWCPEAGWDFDADFVIFTTTYDPDGERIRVRGCNCYVERL